MKKSRVSTNSSHYRRQRYRAHSVYGSGSTSGSSQQSRSSSSRSGYLFIEFEPRDGNSAPAFYDCVEATSYPDQVHRSVKEATDGSSNSDLAKCLLEELQRINSLCFWNPALQQSVSQLRLVGQLAPYTLLLRGDSLHQQNIRTAWARRLLRPPSGFRIIALGELGALRPRPVKQTHFTPLPEAILSVVVELNCAGRNSTVGAIKRELMHTYDGIPTPPRSLIADTLDELLEEQRMLRNGENYFVLPPAHTSLLTSNPFLSLARSVPLPVGHDPWSHYTNDKRPHVPKDLWSQPFTANDVQQQQFEVAAHLNDQLRQADLRQPLYQARSCSVESGSPLKERFPNVQDLKSETATKSSKAVILDDTVPDMGCGGILARSKHRSSTRKPKREGDTKGGLFSRLFSKSMRRRARQQEADVTADSRQGTPQRATFSAQFPPPEWSWFSEHRTVRVAKGVTTVKPEPKPRNVYFSDRVNQVKPQPGLYSQKSNMPWGSTLPMDNNGMVKILDASEARPLKTEPSPKPLVRSPRSPPPVSISDDSDEGPVSPINHYERLDYSSTSTEQSGMDAPNNSPYQNNTPVTSTSATTSSPSDARHDPSLDQVQEQVEESACEVDVRSSRSGIDASYESDPGSAVESPPRPALRRAVSQDSALGTRYSLTPRVGVVRPNHRQAEKDKARKSVGSSSCSGSQSSCRQTQCRQKPAVSERQRSSSESSAALDDLKHKLTLDDSVMDDIMNIT